MKVIPTRISAFLFALFIGLMMLHPTLAQPKQHSSQHALSASARIGCDGVFVEENGLAIMEVESAPVAGSWSLRTDLADYTGTGYYEWKHGDNSMTIESAGKGILTYPIRITKTGTYRFLYRTAAPHSTEHNDAFIRFRDNPVEARTSGGDVINLGQDVWFKVYQGKGQDSWNFAAHTEDGPHQVYAIINTPGDYRLEVSGRSTLFKMDRLSLYHFETVSYGTATNVSTPESECLLPVELTSFTGLINGTEVDLNWTTASELNNAGFEVEFSEDADGPFSTIGYVEGRGITNETTSYRFSHTFAGFEGKTVFYRLKQLDFDGTFEYSPVISMTLPSSAAALLHPAYPNPFNPVTTISFTLPAESHVKLAVYDTMGRQIEALIDDLMPAGYHSRPFQAAGLANGTYIYRLETPSQTLTGSVLLLK